MQRSKRATISDRLVRAQQFELVFSVDVCAQIVDQRRVVDRESFSFWRFNFNHQLGRIRRDGIGSRTFSFGQINWSRRLLRISEARAVTNHLTLVASGKERKSFWTERTRKSENAVTVNSGIAGEDLVQLFSAHAFDRITPKASHCPDDIHASGL